MTATEEAHGTCAPEGAVTCRVEGTSSSRHAKDLGPGTQASSPLDAALGADAQGSEGQGSLFTAVLAGAGLVWLVRAGGEQADPTLRFVVSLVLSALTCRYVRSWCQHRCAAGSGLTDPRPQPWSYAEVRRLLTVWSLVAPIVHGALVAVWLTPPLRALVEEDGVVRVVAAGWMSANLLYILASTWPSRSGEAPNSGRLLFDLWRLDSNDVKQRVGRWLVDNAASAHDSHARHALAELRHDPDLPVKVQRRARRTLSARFPVRPTPADLVRHRINAAEFPTYRRRDLRQRIERQESAERWVALSGVAIYALWSGMYQMGPHRLMTHPFTAYVVLIAATAYAYDLGCRRRDRARRQV